MCKHHYSQIHFRDSHKGIKFECTQCKKHFTSKENLALHQKATHHSLNPVENNVKTQDSTEKVETTKAEQNTPMTEVKYYFSDVILCKYIENAINKS